VGSLLLNGVFFTKPLAAALRSGEKKDKKYSSTNNLYIQTDDVHCNPRNPVNPDSKLINRRNCLIFKLNHFKENIMIFSKNRAAHPRASTMK